LNLTLTFNETPTLNLNLTPTKTRAVPLGLKKIWALKGDIGTKGKMWLITIGRVGSSISMMPVSHIGEFGENRAEKA
jgi:hypothetical protein